MSAASHIGADGNGDDGHLTAPCRVGKPSADDESDRGGQHREDGECRGHCRAITAHFSEVTHLEDRDRGYEHVGEHGNDDLQRESTTVDLRLWCSDCWLVIFECEESTRFRK